MCQVTQPVRSANTNQKTTHIQSCSLSFNVNELVLLCFFGSDLGKLAEPYDQTVLERVLGIRNQSSPVLRLFHGSVW